MNFPALWAYGAGITTGLMWRYAWSIKRHWWTPFAVAFCVVLCLWPVFFTLILIDAYKAYIDSIDGLDHDEDP